MEYIVDYAADWEGAGLSTVKIIAPGRVSAERKARDISKRLHKGGYDGPSVYVYRAFEPNGQRIFFAGRIEDTDDGYWDDDQ